MEDDMEENSLMIAEKLINELKGKGLKFDHPAHEFVYRNSVSLIIAAKLSKTEINIGPMSIFKDVVVPAINEICVKEKIKSMEEIIDNNLINSFTMLYAVAFMDFFEIIEASEAHELIKEMIKDEVVH